MRLQLNTLHLGNDRENTVIATAKSVLMLYTFLFPPKIAFEKLRCVPRIRKQLLMQENNVTEEFTSLVVTPHVLALVSTLVLLF
jgi:hypothetical protein